MAVTVLGQSVVSSISGTSNPVSSYSEDGTIPFRIQSTTSGEVLFHAYEIPERLEYMGGDQLLAVHNFPGGIRTVQTLGFFPAKISFSGWLFPFAGDVIDVTGAKLVATAFQRFQTFKALANSGDLLTLIYGGIRLLGYVEKFQGQVVNQFRVRYTINMVITTDATNLNNDVATQNQQQQLQNWSNQISTVQANAQMPYQIGQPLALLQTALQGVLLNYNAATAADFANLTTLTGDVSSAITTFAPTLASQPAQIQSVLVQTTAILTGLGTTIDTGASGASAQTLQAINPNLFQIAASVYHDPTQWTVIANANNLVDPQPLGQYTLVIPTLPATTSTGVV